MGSVAGYEGLENREDEERYKTLIREICSTMISEYLHPPLPSTITNTTPAAGYDKDSSSDSTRTSTQDLDQTSVSDDGYLSIYQDNSSSTYQTVKPELVC